MRVLDRHPSFRWRLALTGAAVLALTTCTDAGREPVAPDMPLFDATVDDVYDIRALGTHVINGATWNAASNFGVGTGLLKSFLQVREPPGPGADGREEAFNTDAEPEPLDLGNADNFNHSLALNHVPVVKVGTQFFREFILDANEANSDPAANFSIDKFDLWLCDVPAAATFSAVTNFEGNDDCALVYGLDDGPNGVDKALATDANSKGSGSSFDYQILIPEGKFTSAATEVGADIDGCAYAGASATPCGVFLILYVRLGFSGGDFVVGSGFEEFSTIDRPFVTVTKTAVPSFTRTHHWLIAKTVDPTVITLFAEQSQDATWTVTVSPDGFTDSDELVSGTITIANTSGAAVTITSVADAVAGYGLIAPVCPVTFPHSLANDATLVCTYSASAPDTDPGVQTNTATVEIDASIDADDIVDASAFTASADFDFSSATPTEVDADPPVYDDYDGGGETLLGNASGSPFVTPRTYTCDGDEGQFSNTARLDLTDPATDPTASATLTVNCLDLTVSKTAATTLTRTYLWTIEKAVSPAIWDLFQGDEGTSDYSVTVEPADPASTDMDWAVNGTITIENPNTLPVYLQAVTDVISDGGGSPVPFGCEVDLTPVVLAFPYELEAGNTLVCAYSQSLPDAATRTNTVTVSAKPTNVPSAEAKDFASDDVPVDFAGVTVVDVNKTVNVTDDVQGTLGSVTSPGTETFTYSRTFTCDDDQGTHDNTATIEETGQTDDASVTVNCHRVVVQKNATTSYDRDFDWEIAKSADQTALLLSPGQTFGVNYTITVTKSDAQDASHHVTGTIRIAHTHPTRGAVLNSLTDVVSGVAGNATLSDCNVDGTLFEFPGTLDVGAQLRCTYDLDLPDAVERANTATLVQQNHTYDAGGVATEDGTTSRSTSAVPVTFGVPTHTTDDCVVIDDSYSDAGPQGESVCASTQYDYTRQILAPNDVCDDFTVTNTVTLTSDDEVQESDEASVAVDVACPTGCTLTLGYWKTHNESFAGGAPLDDTWNLLPAGELSGFFTTISSYPVVGPNDITAPFTWFSVFWTPPQGNAYYNLAHQYMAAKLNILNNATAPSAVTNAINTAEGLFAANTPASIAFLRGNQKAVWIATAGTLGQYNEGLIGPGHCDEDGTSGQSVISSVHTAVQ